VLPEDAGGSELARNGRVVEMLSGTLGGMWRGTCSRSHGFSPHLRGFAHVIDSMFNRTAKWLILFLCSTTPPWGTDRLLELA